MPEAFNAKAFRRSLNKTGRYTRQPTNDKESLALMDDHGVGYSLRGLVAQIKDNGGVWQQVRSTVNAVSWPASSCTRCGVGSEGFPLEVAIHTRTWHAQEDSPKGAQLVKMHKHGCRGMSR